MERAADGSAAREEVCLLGRPTGEERRHAGIGGSERRAAAGERGLVAHIGRRVGGKGVAARRAGREGG